MCFIGVSTQQSFVNQVFARWVNALGITSDLICIDIELDAPQGCYDEVLSRIKSAQEIRGALVTSHKVSIYEKALVHLDRVDPTVHQCREISVLYKDGSLLCAGVTDLLSVHSALRSILEASRRSILEDADVCVLGCGGAGTALVLSLLSPDSGCCPGRVFVTDNSDHRRCRLLEVLSSFSPKLEINVESADMNDSIVSELREGALVVNATGMGKDRPGSPLSPATKLPRRSIAWDFNYRGDLGFLRDIETYL